MLFVPVWSGRSVLPKKKKGYNSKVYLVVLFFSDGCFTLNLNIRFPSQHQLIHVANNIPFDSFQCSLRGGISHGLDDSLCVQDGSAQIFVQGTGLIGQGQVAVRPPGCLVFYAAKHAAEPRDTTPTVPESPQRVEVRVIGLCLGSGWSSSTCKLQVDDTHVLCTKCCVDQSCT